MDIKKIVLTVGVFDCFHEGHADLFDAMRLEAGADGHVAVIVHDDWSTYKNKRRVPVQDVRRRTDVVRVLVEPCQMQTCHEADPSSAINAMVHVLRDMFGDKVELVYMRGDDWTSFPGRTTVERLGMTIKFKPYFAGASTTARREEIGVIPKT